MNPAAMMDRAIPGVPDEERAAAMTPVPAARPTPIGSKELYRQSDSETSRNRKRLDSKTDKDNGADEPRPTTITPLIRSNAATTIPIAKYFFPGFHAVSSLSRTANTLPQNAPSITNREARTKDKGAATMQDTTRPIIYKTIGITA